MVGGWGGGHLIFCSLFSKKPFLVKFKFVALGVQILMKTGSLEKFFDVNGEVIKK